MVREIKGFSGKKSGRLKVRAWILHLIALTKCAGIGDVGFSRKEVLKSRVNIQLFDNQLVVLCQKIKHVTR